MSTTKDIKESLRELAASPEKRSETARLRDIFDDVEAAIAAGIKAKDILETLHKNGFTMEMSGFRSAIQRIRNKRKNNPNKITAATLQKHTPKMEREILSTQSKPPVKGGLPIHKKPEVNLDELFNDED